jgi:hypothetical protein
LGKKTGDLGGTNNKNPLIGNTEVDVSQKQHETLTKRRSLQSSPSPAKFRLRPPDNVDSNSNSAILPPDMKLGEGRGGEPFITAPSLEPTSPSVKLWQAVDVANRQAAVQRGTPLLDESRQQVLRNYLTTQASLTDLIPLAGVSTKQGVHDQLRRDMGRVFEYLPEEVRAKYETPEDALREKTATPTELTIRKQKQGLDKLGRADIDKIEFSDEHRKNLLEAQARRSQAIREGTYEGRPVGRPRNENVTANQSVTDTGRRSLKPRSSSPTLYSEFMRKSKEAKEGIQPEDQPSE